MGAGKLFIRLVILGGVISCFLPVVSCSPRIYERIVYQRDTTYIDRVQVDSVSIRDSVFVKQVRDTVIIYKEKIREKYKYLRDTIAIVKVDSVAYETIKEVAVEKPLSWWQRLRTRAFWWLIAIALIGWRRELLAIAKKLIKLLAI